MWTKIRYVVSFSSIPILNWKAINKQELLDLQYPLRKADYNFLKYDSFLSATSVKERSIEQIVKEINENTTQIKGILKKEQ